MRKIPKKPTTSKLKLLLAAIISLLTLTAVAAWCNKQPIAGNRSKVNGPVSVCGVKS